MSVIGQVTFVGMAPSLPSLRLPLLLIVCAMLHPSAVASGGAMLMLDRFHRWMTAHGRVYPSIDEKLHRLEVYRRNVEFIEASNRESERLGYELGENEFTDLTNEEFVARYTGAAVPREDADAMDDGMGTIITTLAGDVSEGSRASIVDLNALVAPPPQNFDWRDHGVVTPAKAQGGCGCCWAFATVATVESLNKIKGGQLLDLSEQELLDCNRVGQYGCKGGYIEKALNWIKAKGGVVTEATYPYQERQGQCKNVGGATRVGKITGAQRVRGEPQMKLAVLDRPVGVLFDANGAILQNWKSGIYKGPCTTKQNHAVVLVGYGVSNTGEEYWIIKNSWGAGWGQKGFFFMRRGADGAEGLCGVAVWGTYPLM
uniref:Uncharacterized protein n=1 Tax=Avena sativa TaxID=4498 RepID=A0ACD5UGX9_AVESA